MKTKPKTFEDAIRKLPTDVREVLREIWNECGQGDFGGGELISYLTIIKDCLRCSREKLNKVRLITQLLRKLDRE